MAFSKWYPDGFKDLPDKSTPVSAAALNNIEDGLADHESRISGLEGDSGAPVEWDDVDNKPSTFPPDPHVHEIGDVTGLQAALDDKQAAGSYAPASHTHTVSDVTGLQTTLDGKASATHTHAQSDVTGLSSALAGKAPVSHTHGYADLPRVVATAYYIDGEWEARPTSDLDVPVWWIGGSLADPPSGTLGPRDLHFPDAD